MFGRRRNTEDIWKIFDEIFSQFDQQNGEWKTSTKVSDDGTTIITSRFWSNVGPKSNGSNLDKLKYELEKAIESEDFEKAVELRDKIKSLETNKKEIEELEADLKKSIENQDFEKSIEIRDKLKSLRK